MKFTTWDEDHDRSSYNCASLYRGGWWYNFCHDSNLNGKYVGAAQHNWHYVIWFHWKHKEVALKATAMLIRPKN
jgi:hypothetical protein